MDCHSVNVYKEEKILSPFLHTTHLYSLVIRTYSMFTVSYEKLLQVYCLDSVLLGIQNVCHCPSIMCPDKARREYVLEVLRLKTAMAMAFI